jgi:hypothetical protein
MALWTPSQITTALWLDASDNSTITLNGSTVSQWNDKSGNDRHAVQATAGQQPTLTAAGLNGLDVLTMDGGDHMITSNVFTSASDVTVFLVHKATTIDSTGNAVFALQNGLDNSNGYLHCLARSDISNHFRSFFTTDSAGSNATNQAPPTDFTTGVWRVTEHSRSATAARFGISGVVSEISASGQCNFTSAKGIIGCYFSLNYEWIGQIAFVMVVPSYLGTEDRQICEGYIHWHFGLQGNLAADHPYKSAAPTTNKVSGTVTVNGSPAARTVAVFRRSDFTLLGTTTSNASPAGGV